MKLLLTLPEDAGLGLDTLQSQDIEVYDDDELDGPTMVNALLDLTNHIPAIAAGVAGSLIAINRSIDEMSGLVKRFAKKAGPKERYGVFEGGQRVLASNATDKEIDQYFADFKARAAQMRDPP